MYLDFPVILYFNQSLQLSASITDRQFNKSYANIAISNLIIPLHIIDG